jgi:hypothetical protein
MAIERIYTLPELAELTGRDASFWATECSEGRLACLGTGPDEDSVLVLGSDFESWVSRLRRGPETVEDPRGRISPVEAYLTPEEQEACIRSMKAAQALASSA